MVKIRDKIFKIEKGKKINKSKDKYIFFLNEEKY